MALSLGVHVGDWFYLNAAPVRVRSLAGYYSATVEVDGKTFKLSAETPVEIYPRVRVRCATPQSGKMERQKAVHRLIIDAPLSIRIPIVIRRAAQSAKATCARKFARSRRHGMRFHEAVSRLSSIHLR